jgi:hypothetical protein
MENNDRRRSGRSRWLLRVAGGLAALLALGVVRLPSAENGAKRPADVLRALVGELIDYQVELSEEETRWQEEREHLATTIALIEKERSALDREIAAAREESETAAAEREKLEHDTAAARTALDEIGESLERQGQRLLGAFRALPGPVQDPLDAAAARVAGALSSESEEPTVLERLRLVTAFAADIERALSSVHAIKEILEIPEAGRMEVDVLCIGGAFGYYVSIDGRHAGIVARGPDGWQVLPRGGEVASQVRRARAVFQKEAPAAIVELPVLPGEGS